MSVRLVPGHRSQPVGPPRASFRQHVGSLLLAAGTLLTAACGAAAAPTARVDLIVADMSLRAEGVECAGTGPLYSLHAGAAFRITDADNKVLASGTLPPGVSKRALTTDFGKAVRIPTVCAMDIVVDGGIDRSAAWLRVSSAEPIRLTPTGQPELWSAQVPDSATSAGSSSTAGGS